MDNGTYQNSSTNETSNTSDISTADIIILFVKGIFIFGIIFGAAFGNVLVILSVVKFKRLRSNTNFFIVSLAFADFLVATLVMPFNASLEFFQKWIFGSVMCDIYNSNDVLFSTASILHLCCISVDRYLAIMRPLVYELKMTKKKIAIMLGLTWSASCLISYIPVQTQIYTTAETLELMRNDPELCIFDVNKIYAFISSTVSFSIPCVIMVFVYAKIFKEAKRQEEQINAMQKMLVPLRSVPLQPERGRSSVDSGNNSFTSYHDQSLDQEQQIMLRNKQERKKMRKEHKAAKTLGIIMGAFILCWLPFFLWYFITSMCGKACPYPDILVSILFWIGYFNSCLNPLIYAFFNREFRTAFKNLLGCGRKRRQPLNGYDLHSNTYVTDYGAQHESSSR